MEPLAEKARRATDGWRSRPAGPCRMWRLLDSALCLTAAMLLRIRRAPPTVRPRLRKGGDVRSLDPLDFESALGDEREGGFPRYVTAFEHAVRNGLRPALPASHARDRVRARVSSRGGRCRFTEITSIRIS